MTREELEQNAFLVLGLAPSATRLELERAGQKLLAQLAIGAASAGTYQTPFGARPRDEALVRRALAAVRDPATRVKLELWAETAPLSPSPAPEPWAEAARSVGWRKPWAARR
jgi:hypothetical protein